MPVVYIHIASRDSLRIRLFAKYIHRDPLQANAAERAPWPFLHLIGGGLRSIKIVPALGALEMGSFFFP